jgi:LAO/AO transport system kinase
MNRLNMDPGVFIRSMATKGQLGGISRAAFDASIILDAAGFDYLLVETVGAGQSDISVAGLAHTVLLVMAPGLGDEIQALKAGLMEIVDIYVLNKSDQASKHDSLGRIRAVLTERPSGWKPRIVRTVATTGEGIGDLISAVNEHRTFVSKTDSPEKAKARAMGEIEWARDHLVQTTWSTSATTEAQLAKLVGERKLDPYSAAARLLKHLRSRG